MNGRTAFYTPNLGGGGAQRVIVNLARGLIERGHDVDIVVAKAAGPLLEDVPDGARLIDLGSGGVLGSLPRLARYMKRERPDAMLSTMSHCNVVAILARWVSRSEMRLIVREATTLTFHEHRASSVRERAVYHLMKRLYPRADMVVANSLDTAADLVRHGIAGEDHVRVIHNPIFSSGLVDKQKAGIEHPWFGDNEIPVLLGIGRLNKSKDHETMIRAFGIVRKDRCARLIILGEGAERGRLLELIVELGLEKDVELPGFALNPHAYIARASAVALSSRWEGFGNVLVEALAAGTPVISTDCPGGPSEILEGGKYGKLVPVGDAEAFAGAIMDTLDDPPERDFLIERAEDFSIDTVTSQYIDVLGVNRL